LKTAFSGKVLISSIAIAATVTYDFSELIDSFNVAMPPLLAILHATSGRVITGNDSRSCEAMNSGT